jgi:hypothetical protein
VFPPPVSTVGNLLNNSQRDEIKYVCDVTHAGSPQLQENISHEAMRLVFKDMNVKHILYKNKWKKADTKSSRWREFIHAISFVDLDPNPEAKDLYVLGTKYVHIKSTTVYAPRRNWDSPNPFLASECSPPPRNRGEGGHTSLRVGGWGESQFRRGAYTVVLFICTYFVVLGLLDPDPLVRVTDPVPDPDPSIIKQN